VIGTHEEHPGGGHRRERQHRDENKWNRRNPAHRKRRFIQKSGSNRDPALERSLNG
jgi:hypothetical protein